MKTFHSLLVAAVALFGLPAAIGADNLYVDNNTIRQVQETLNQRGFRTGTDGVMGPRTQAALKKFQSAENLDPTGQLNRQTLVALGILRDESARADAPRYSADTVRKVQQTLNHRGFRAGPADGVMSTRTRTALREFQRSENLEDTGQLNPRTLTALGVQPQAPVARAARAEPPAVSGDATIREAQRRLMNRGFYAGPANGLMNARMQEALREFQRSENLEDSGHLTPHTLAALGLGERAARLDPPLVHSELTVRDVQRRLQSHGFYHGPIDGVMGAETRTALANFQRSQNLVSTGRLNHVTLAALGLGQPAAAQGGSSASAGGSVQPADK